MLEVQEKAVEADDSLWRTELTVPRSESTQEVAFYLRHKPVVDAWLAEYAERKDPWIQSASHAAFCYLNFLSSWQDKLFDWGSFDARRFVLEDIGEGGTLHFHGCYKVFYDQLLEALRRFVDGGLLERALGERYLAEMEGLREEYLEMYRPLTPEEEAEEQARCEQEELERLQQLVARERALALNSTTPCPKKRAAARARRKQRKRTRRGRN